VLHEQSRIWRHYESLGRDPNLVPFDRLNTARLHGVAPESIATLAEVPQATRERMNELLHLVDLNEAAHRSMATIDACYFKRKDRGTELGIPVAVLDEIEADGVQHNNELIDQLGGLADSIQSFKDRLTSSEKSELDTEWANNKASVKARFDQILKEMLLEENVHPVEITCILEDRDTAYSWMDSGIDFVLDKLKTETENLASERGQPDHGLAQAQPRNQWTKSKVIAVIIEVVWILIVILACVKYWILCFILFFIVDYVKSFIRKIEQCRKGQTP